MALSPTQSYRALTATLRTLLKARSFTYKEIASALGVSEQTIKRLFSSEDGSVGRLAEVCELIGLSLIELVRLTDDDSERTFLLSEDQERHFCDHPEDYAFFDALLSGSTPEQIAAKHELPPRRVTAYVRQLEALGLVERMTGNRVRLLVSGSHNWRDGGPMQRKYITDMNVEFVRDSESLLSTADSNRHFLTCAERRVTTATLKNMTTELREVFVKFRRMAQRDESLEPADRLVSVRWLALMAPRPGTFDGYLRPKS